MAIQRVSVGAGGIEANDSSFNASISGDGRYVAFLSFASNLIEGDTNGYSDIFVYDRQTNTTQRVSVGVGGIQANDSSYFASISGDGRYVAFQSDASNLVAGDTNRSNDIFVYDRQTNTTQRVSVGTEGIQANDNSWNASISADGRYVAFESSASNLVAGDTNNNTDIFVYDRQTNTTQRVSVGAGGIQADGGSFFPPSISGDGRYVTFQSDASNLVVGDTNNRVDIFVYDRQTNTTQRVSVGAGGVEGNAPHINPSISADGSYVTFESSASNLVPGETNNNSAIFGVELNTNTPPVANPDTVSATPNTALNIPVATLLSNDTDANNDPLTLTGVSNFTEGTAVLNNNGTPSNSADDFITFTPNSGFSGNASFNYSISDGKGGSSSATVTVAVGGTQNGGSGNDTLIGTAGNDSLNGSSGNDTVYGNAGNDTLIGGNGSDLLFGGAGNDLLNGGNGTDTLRAGLGNDTLIGGLGADVFVFAALEGTDTITDFSLGQGDKIGLTSGLTFGQLSFSGSEIRVGSEVLSVLTGVNTATLTASNFVTV